MANRCGQRSEALQLARHYDLQAVPVTTDQGQLLGIVTVDDLMDAARQENTETWQQQALLILSTAGTRL